MSGARDITLHKPFRPAGEWRSEEELSVTFGNDDDYWYKPIAVFSERKNKSYIDVNLTFRFQRLHNSLTSFQA